MVVEGWKGVLRGCLTTMHLKEMALEIFISFEKFKWLNKRKYFVIPTASHKLHIFVTYKCGTPFAFLKRNKIFQCGCKVRACDVVIKRIMVRLSTLGLSVHKSSTVYQTPSETNLHYLCSHP